MTTFTKMELINTAIKQIRIYIKLYKEYNDLKYIHSANDVAHSLFKLDIITWNKTNLLSNIISNIAFPNANKKGD